MSGPSVSGLTRRAARSIAAWRFPQTRALRSATAAGVPAATASCTAASAWMSSPELPQEERHAFAFGFERSDDPERARRVGGEPRFGQLEDVVARDVGDRALDGLRIELAFGQQEPELFDFLLRRDEVALAAVGEGGERLRRGALALASEARGDPRGKRVALERVDGDRDARACSSAENHAEDCVARSTFGSVTSRI